MLIHVMYAPANFVSSDDFYELILLRFRRSFFLNSVYFSLSRLISFPFYCVLEMLDSALSIPHEEGRGEEARQISS